MLNRDTGKGWVSSCLVMIFCVPDRSVAFDAGVDQALARWRVRTSATHFYTGLQEVEDG